MWTEVYLDVVDVMVEVQVNVMRWEQRGGTEKIAEQAYLGIGDLDVPWPQGCTVALGLRSRSRSRSRARTGTKKLLTGRTLGLVTQMCYGPQGCTVALGVKVKVKLKVKVTCQNSPITYTTAHATIVKSGSVISNMWKKFALVHRSRDTAHTQCLRTHCQWYPMEVVRPHNSRTGVGSLNLAERLII